MSDFAIRVEGLSKQYRIGGKAQKYLTLNDALTQWGTRVAGSFSRDGGSERNAQLFWALKDISFEVKHGEAVGIIGPNGAGKSTLLKILTRITKPTDGYAMIQGRVASLLEVGTGFHPELTGRENIYLNGAILGMKRAEIDRKFDEIVDFSGIDEFIDTPVKRYSSGMHVRLAFAVAAHLEPEILLVDEVLAVGDAAFQRKCLGKMGQVAEGGRTILFVSHNMVAIERLCHRAIWLDGGRKRGEGFSEQIVREYLDASIGNRDLSVPLAERRDRRGNGRLRFTGVRLRVDMHNEIKPIRVGDTVEFIFSYIVPEGKPVSNAVVFFILTDYSRRKLVIFNTRVTEENFAFLPPRGNLVCRVPRFPLLPGKYFLDLRANVDSIRADQIDNAATVEVIAGDFFGRGEAVAGGDFVCDHSWSLDGSGS